MVGRGNFFLTVLLSCIVLFGFSKELSGGCLTGRVVDIRQNPIPYASVYIHQLSTGIAADTQGNFRITLNPGGDCIDARIESDSNLRLRLVVMISKKR